MQSACISQKALDEDLRCCFVSPFPFPKHTKTLIVLIGPTIGIGDETLMARAVLERARQLGGLSVWVSSHNHDIWSRLDEGSRLLELPPLGGHKAIADLDAGERGLTGLLYLDFLESDPSWSLYDGPSGISFAARWYMGPAIGMAIDCGRGMRYELRYPSGLPSSRWIQSRWFTRSLLRGVGVPLPNPAVSISHQPPAQNRDPMPHRKTPTNFPAFFLPRGICKSIALDPTSDS